MIVVYLAHPIGDTNGDDAITKQDNIANAGEWLRFLVETTTWSVIAPWYLYQITHGTATWAPRRLVDQLLVLDRCDLLILCGGWVSPHMHLEIRRAHRRGIPVLDMTMMGVVPPDPNDESAVQVIAARARRAITSRPRRVWMPLLSEPDVAALKHARHSLYVHMPDDHADAVAIVDRIIAAAVDDPTA